MRYSSADKWATFEEELNRADAQSLRRRLRVVEKKTNASLQFKGRSFINFSSNDYLGLSQDDRLQQAAQCAAAIWGTGATASRLISGSTQLHETFEAKLAHWLGAETALLFPSGYAANAAVVSALVGPGDAVVMDRLSHASLIDAVRLCGARLFVYPHKNLAGAQKALERTAAYRRRLLISDSVFSMDGDFAPVRALAALAEEFNAISLLDEAHALGVWGPVGAGIATDRSAVWDVRTGTLSKAFGSQGGFIASSRRVIDLIVNRGRAFIYTTGLSPLCAGAAQEALRQIKNEPERAEKVKRLSSQLRDGLHDMGFDTLDSESQIIPLLTGSAERALNAAQHLWDHGIFAPAMRPPTVHAGECRLRFSVTAAHDKADIQKLLVALHALAPMIQARVSEKENA